MSTTKPLKKSDDKLELIPSNTPTSFTDRVIVAQETDGLILMRFISHIPNLIIENHRTIIKPNIVINLINILCRITGHYPSKPRKKTAPKKTPKTSK